MLSTIVLLLKGSGGLVCLLVVVLIVLHVRMKQRVKLYID